MEDYEYSSWGEYTGRVEPVSQICGTRTDLNRIQFKYLEALVEEPWNDNVPCFDIEDPSLIRLSDKQIWSFIIRQTDVTNNSDFQKMDRDKQRQIIADLRKKGASVRQLQRLTGLGRGLIQRL